MTRISSHNSESKNCWQDGENVTVMTIKMCYQCGGHQKQRNSKDGLVHVCSLQTNSWCESIRWREKLSFYVRTSDAAKKTMTKRWPTRAGFRAASRPAMTDGEFSWPYKCFIIIQIC